MRTSRAGAAAPFVQSATSGDAESGSSAVPRLASLAAKSSSRRARSRSPLSADRPTQRLAAERRQIAGHGEHPEVPTVGSHQHGAGLARPGGARPEHPLPRRRAPPRPSPLRRRPCRRSPAPGCAFRSALLRIIVRIVRRIAAVPFSVSMPAANAGVMTDFRRVEGRRIGRRQPSRKSSRRRPAPRPSRCDRRASAPRAGVVVRKRPASRRIASAFAWRCAASSNSAAAGL